jgi:cysteine-rich repeat protein
MNIDSLLGTARLRARLVVAIVAAAGIFACSQGCSGLGGNDATSDDHLCTPGAYVFCRCADRSEGTKLCRDDGKSFEPCTTGEDGLCAGGEIDDPNSGNPVAPPSDEDAGPTDNQTGGPEAEACPGKAVALTPGVDTIITDDTTGAEDDAKGKPGACAVGSGGGDHVYHLQPKGTGSLKLTVQGTAPLDPTVYIRSTCSDEASQTACSETTPAGGTETLNVNVVTGHDYYLFVDGASGTAGKYKITAHLTTGSFCGDGKVDMNEACDDANKIEGDGCSNDCKKVDGDPASANGCPGQPVHIWPGKTVDGSGSTTPYGNAFTKTGSSCIVSASDLNAAQDHVYAVTAHATGNLEVLVGPSDPAWNVELVARTTCTDPSTQGAGMCGNDGAAGELELISFPVTDGQTVYVAVDGVLNAKGAYTITFDIE